MPQVVDACKKIALDRELANFIEQFLSRSEPLADSPGCSNTEAARSMNSIFHL